MHDEQPTDQKPEKPARFRLNRKLSTVLICLLIAIVFWLLLALSRDYPGSISFPVEYKNLPGTKVIVNDLPDTVKFHIRTSGFKLLAYNFSRKRKSIEVDVASRLYSGRQFEDEILALPTRAFAADFSRQFGSDISILSYQPDSIIFYFSDLVSKRLPVKLNLQLDFEKQYNYAGDVILIPDCMLVSGPPSIVNELDFIETETLSLSDVRNEIKAEVRLKEIRLLTYTASQVRVMVPVEKYTEGSVEVRIQPVNVKKGYSLKIFPDRTTVRYMVALSKFNDVKDHYFEVVADADKVSGQSAEQMTISLTRYPDFVHSVSIDPAKVDFILRRE